MRGVSGQARGAGLTQSGERGGQWGWRGKGESMSSHIESLGLASLLWIGQGG